MAMRTSYLLKMVLNSYKIIMTKVIKKITIYLFLSIICGYILLCLASMIPYKYLHKQIEESADILNTLPTYAADPLSGRLIDNNADSIMLLVSAYEGQESVFKEASDSYYERISGVDARESLIKILSGEKGSVVSYSRYWHGYKIFLVPLLLILNLEEIRMLQKIMQAFLIICLGFMIQRRMPRVLFPYSFLILFLAPTAVGGCLEFSSAFVIMIISCIVLLLNPIGVFSENNVAYLFFISGILTAYFDFLTAPTITLTVPLTLLCMMRANEKNSIVTILICAFMWCFGYIGMWAGKWGIAFFSRGMIFIRELLNQMEFRLSVSDPSKESITRIGVLIRNYGMLFNTRYVTALVGGDLILLLLQLFKQQNCLKLLLKKLVLFQMPILISVLWILIMTNHSSIHYWFTYRTLAPTIFCLLCSLSCARLPSFDD